MSLGRKTEVKLAVAAVVLAALDLWTKSLISANFRLGESKKIIDGLLDLTLVHNSGAAFGMGPRWSPYFFIVTSILAIGFVIYLIRKMQADEIRSAWGLALVLSGALGNLVDRIRFGYVVDFVLVYLPRAKCPSILIKWFRTCQWPAFNVADAAITVGAILFALDLLMRRKSKSAADSESSFQVK